MLYTNTDGTIWIDDRPEPFGFRAERERERGERMRMNEERYREMERSASIAMLESRIAEMDADMEAEGVEDATAWERFPEYEKLLYALAERIVERQEREREVEELAELAEMAEENALTELAAFGFFDIMDDFEECANFALVDGYINYLEEQFAIGNVGGAEIYEYNELMGEFCELMRRG